MDKILIFSGTTEGKKLAYTLANDGFRVILCVATAYGEQVVAPHDNITVHTGRLDQAQMEAFILQQNADKIVDATHPYAQVVTAQLVEICAKLQVEYLRLLRAESTVNSQIMVESTAKAVEFLQNTQGNILLTTGSKELAQFTTISDYQKRIYARVLPTAEVASQCEALGFRGKNLIMMQGPFSQEMNQALLAQINATWLVTKEGGATGGFPEKVAAAEKMGVRVLMITRPQERSKSYNFAQIMQKLTGKNPDKCVKLVGIGMGDISQMTQQAQQAIACAELVLGSGRMLDYARNLGKTVVDTYKTSEMVDVIAQSDATQIAVALSGDAGFYSAATALRTVLAYVQNVTVETIAGISSVVYLCAKLGTTWQDAKLVSLHGRAGNLPAAVRTNRKVFAIVGGGDAVKSVLQTLCDYQLGEVTVHIGFDLSYPSEKVVSGTANALNLRDLHGLCAVLVENPDATDVVTHGLPDDAFIRGQAPMTKEEIRAISLAKLRLTRDAIIYDVGAGTGSVALEMARMATDGQVYAIERKSEACDLIAQNQVHLGLQNVTIVRGLAPEMLADLPAPTHVFIGGSAGNMREIVQCVLAKNPSARIVINTVTLESVAEATEIVSNFSVSDVDIAQVTVAKNRKLGKYNLMTGGNPVYIYSFTGCLELEG